MRADYRKLGDHVPPPVNQNKVLDYITQLNAPFTIGEVWRPLGLPRTAVQKVLDRLTAKGILTRYPVRVPVTLHGGAKFSGDREYFRKMYLYQLADTE